MRIERGAYRLIAALALLACGWVAGLGLGSCAQSDSCGVTKTGNPSNSCEGDLGDLGNVGGGVLGALKMQAEACGIDVDCDTPGIELGNASISGLTSIDTFFATVLRFQVETEHASAVLTAELDALRAGFGIAPSTDFGRALRAEIAAHVDGDLVVRAAPPSCRVEARAALDASARCMGEAASDAAPVACRGECELSLDGALECDAGAQLSCTVSSAATTCAGACVGRCTSMLSGAAACAGICNGSCTGRCTRYADSGYTMCAGQCDGMCVGSCEIELPAGTTCDGVCTGECTVVDAPGSCESPIRARCVPPAGATVRCAGRCAGEVELPASNPECEAAASAQALMAATCSVPRVTIAYRLAAGVDAQSSARFEQGVAMLRERLPYLLAELVRAEQLVAAGAVVSGPAVATVARSISSRVSSAAADGDLRVAFGAACALSETAAVPRLVEHGADRVGVSVAGATDLLVAIGLRN